MAIDRTVQAIYDKAIYLIDAQNENSGATTTADTREYRVRTIGILNSLLDVVYPYSSNYEAAAGTPGEIDDIESFEDEVDLDARMLRSVLPNGLAARLISEEDPSLANFFQQNFETFLAEARRGTPAVFEEVGGSEETLPYGGIEYGQFSRW